MIDNTPTYQAATAILQGKDPDTYLDAINDPARRTIAREVAQAITSVPMFHAQKIAAMRTVEQRRDALDRLPAKLRPAVQTRLRALWEQRSATRARS